MLKSYLGWRRGFVGDYFRSTKQHIVYARMMYRTWLAQFPVPLRAGHNDANKARFMLQAPSHLFWYIYMGPKYIYSSCYDAPKPLFQ